MRTNKTIYNDLLNDIGQTIESARQNAFKTVNAELVKANWQIGRHIVGFEQQGHERAEYGSELLTRLAKDLRLRFGKGFGRRNVLDMCRFYMAYPIWQPLAAKLSWTHFTILLGISDETAQKFYEEQAIHENWSKRELERQRISNKIFVSEYQLYLPDKRVLQNR